MLGAARALLLEAAAPSGPPGLAGREESKGQTRGEFSWGPDPLVDINTPKWSGGLGNCKTSHDRSRSRLVLSGPSYYSIVNTMSLHDSMTKEYES